jgi:hypothetical protein
MICHELDIFRTAKVTPFAGITKFDRSKITKMPLNTFFMSNKW